MSIHKYKDWASWWDGLRTKALQAGAEALVTNITTMLGSNGVASMIPALHDYALSWKTALITTLTQFILRSILAAAQYVQAQPDASIIEVDSDPAAFTRPPQQPSPQPKQQ